MTPYGDIAIIMGSDSDLPTMEAAIESGLPASKLREIACSEGMIELSVGGLSQAKQGITSIEEVYFKMSG